MKEAELKRRLLEKKMERIAERIAKKYVEDLEERVRGALLPIFVSLPPKGKTDS